MVGEVLGYLAAQLAVAEPALAAAAGAAGVVIGITSVKARRNIGRHWRAHAFRHYPGFNFPGGIPPGISGYNNDASSPFWQESTPFRLEFGEFPRQFRAIRHGQPRPSIPSAVAPFPARRPPFAPAFRRPPPAASRGPPAWPYDLAGALGGRSGPGGEVVGGREYTYTERATTGKINTRNHLPGAPITIVLRAVRVYKSGSSREGLFRALPAHSPGPGGSGVGRYT